MIQLVMADNSEQITAQYIPSQETRVTGEKGSTTTNIFSLFWFKSYTVLGTQHDRHLIHTFCKTLQADQGHSIASRLSL
jgi:hypothetical protein